MAVMVILLALIATLAGVVFFLRQKSGSAVNPWIKVGDDKAGDVYMSLVVPAYNEQSRITTMLDQTVRYCSDRHASDSKFTWEILIVDDGSRDRTVEVVKQYIADHERTTKSNNVGGLIRLMKLPANVGKGGAVRRGMLNAQGRMLLMVDADGATEISDLQKLEDAIARMLQSTSSISLPNSSLGIAVGSRAHLVESDSVVKRAWYRNIPMYVFHFLVDSLCVRGIRDTQCGFKLFTRSAARRVFADLHIERWAFDVELLYIAQRRNIKVVEVPVKWTEIDGSHLSVFGSSIQMFGDLLRIRFLYLSGYWGLTA